MSETSNETGAAQPTKKGMPALKLVTKHEECQEIKHLRLLNHRLKYLFDEMMHQARKVIELCIAGSGVWEQ